MGFFRGYKDHFKEHSSSPQNAAVSPKQSHKAASIRLQKLGDLFSESKEHDAGNFYQLVEEETVYVAAPTIDMSDFDEEYPFKGKGSTTVSIHENMKPSENNGRKITFERTGPNQHGSFERTKSRHDVILQRAGSISLMTTRDSIKRSVSRKIARSESRLQTLLLASANSRGAVTSSGGVTPVTLSPRGGPQSNELISHAGKILCESRASSINKRIRDIRKVDENDNNLGEEKLAKAIGEDKVYLVGKVKSDFSLTPEVAKQAEPFGIGAFCKTRKNPAELLETMEQSAPSPKNNEDLSLPKRRTSKRPPPLLNSDFGTASGESTSDWPITSVFEHDGGFITGGFKITVEGMIGRPAITTREDVDCELEGEIPQSDRNLVIIRSLKEIGPGVTIGSGAAGRVYLAEHIPSKRTIAMKVVSVFDKEKRNQLLKELETLSTYVSRFLVRFHGAFYDGSGAVHIALEYMDHGCLSTFIQKVGPIPESVVQMIAIDCVRGLRFLHENHVLHRDLKTANILLSRRLCCAKLSDFGLARDLNAGVSRVETFVGTVAYMSPERLEGSKYTYASDVWALGVSIVECLLGRYPFGRPQNYFDYIDATITANMWGTCDQSGINISSQARDFITQCTFAEPKQRPLAKDLMEHPWLAGVKKDIEVFGSWLDHCRIKSMQVSTRSP